MADRRTKQHLKDELRMVYDQVDLLKGRIAELESSVSVAKITSSLEALYEKVKVLPAPGKAAFDEPWWWPFEKRVRVILDGEECWLAGVFAAIEHDDDTRSINVPLGSIKQVRVEGDRTPTKRTKP